MLAAVSPLEVLSSRQVRGRIGGEIARVASGSPAEQAGIEPGDWLLAIDGLAIRDVIDYSYESAAEALELTVERLGERRTLAVEKRQDGELGLEFVLPVFEGIRECNNNCEFCFIRGLPRGLRRSLYIRDDDYRYSYLFGTFLTLTNLSESDWQRIGYQKLSPLHVSVHATDLWVRRQMLANPEAPDILAQLDRLAALGVEVKAQVVLCPGINDGAVLERTVADLAARAGTVLDSVAIVPVGLTRHSSARGLRALTRPEARAIVRRARGWQGALRRRLGRDFVYLSDELYLLAGAPFPPRSRYDGFRQLQNGVGLTRLLLDEWRRARRQNPRAPGSDRQVVWVCGRAAAAALRTMAADLTGDRGRVTVLEVENQLFGGGVTVSGLLAGEDIAAELRRVRGDLAVLPRSAFGFEGQQTLDGWTPEAIALAGGIPVALAAGAADLLSVTLGD